MSLNFKLPIYVFQFNWYFESASIPEHVVTHFITWNKLAMRSCQLFLTRQNVEHILVGQVIMLPTPQSNNLKSQMRGCCNKRIFYSSFFSMVTPPLKCIGFVMLIFPRSRLVCPTRRCECMKWLPPFHRRSWRA